ncbi:MAG: AGE family epimerase/isomerase [Spirochaetales bacterium]|nr:AGE family epimerase/isomerase [Spirochaetales bacterium]
MLNLDKLDQEIFYKDFFLKDVIPFWEEYSPDYEMGGYFSCLDRAGTIFDTDKFIWMQAREVWMFSHLYNQVEKRSKWLELAKLGADFLCENGRDKNGNFYFSLTRDGTPLTAPYNIYSDCFSVIAFAEYAKASGEEWALELAVKTYKNIQNRKDNPKGQFTKQYPQNRPIRAMGFSMIQINMAQILSEYVENIVVEEFLNEAIEDVFNFHVDPVNRLVWERVSPDGSHPDCMEGRLITPGHACEVLWFILKIAEKRDDRKLIDKCCEALLFSLEIGWDQEYGGIYYYRDAKGFPTEKIESDMKLWWVHAESIYAFLLAWKLTGRKDLKDWYLKIAKWSFQRFPDSEYGEWYGYLNRSGEPSLSLKGGKWKGFFHLPRMLLEAADTLGKYQ